MALYHVYNKKYAPRELVVNIEEIRLLLQNQLYYLG